MASWADAVPEFNPYIAQQPVEAMRQVGMNQELQFRQGIATVQEWTNNLLSLPIAKAETQQYVKEQIGRLQTTLRTSIAGDFSDQRLINQIGGLAGKISSDPIVQNGVKSTAAIQAGMAATEQSKKDGKWSVQNEAMFNDGVSQWLNDGDVETTFSGSYSPWVDYTDRFMKLYKEANPGQDITQDAFRIQDGKIVVNPVMAEGVSPAKIQAIWNTVSSQPDVQQQLGIDGWYKYRDLSPQQMATNLQVSTNQSLASIESTIRNLETQVATNSSTNNPAVSQQIEQLKQLAQTKKASADQIFNQLQTPGGFEAAKAGMVNQDVLSNLIGAYSYETLKKSPLWETSMQQAEFNQKVRDFDLTYAETKRMNDWKIKKEAAELEINAAKAAKEAAAKTGASDVAVVDAPISTETAILGSSTATQDVEDAKFQYNQSQRELASTLAGAGKKPYILNPVSRLWEPNVGTADYQFQNERQADEAAKQMLAKGQDDYINGAVQDDLVKSKMRESDGLYKNLENKRSIISEVEKLAAPQLNKVRASLGDIRRPVQYNGRNYTFDNQDMIDVYSVKENLPGAEVAKSRLDRKYGDADNFISTMVDTPPPSQIDELNLPPLLGLYATNSRKLSKDKSLIPAQQFIENEYRKRQSAQVTKDITLPTDEKSNDRNFQNFSALANAEAQLNEGSDRGAANELLALLNQDDKAYKSNQYSTGFNPSTGRAYIQIRRGNEPAVRLEMPTQRWLQVYSQFAPNNTFGQLYGSALSAGQGNTNYKLQGRASGFQVDMPKESPYTVQYHLERKGNNNYDVFWWVTPKPTADNKNPAPIINGERANGTVPGMPLNPSEAEVLQWTQNGFKNMTFLQGYLQSKLAK